MPNPDLAENTVVTESTHPTQIANADLVDELGAINELRKSLEQREKELKDEVKRRGGRYYEGNNYFVNVTEQVRNTLNKNAVIDRLGQDWVDRHSSTTSYRAVSVAERSD